jgi:hypothetical protein
VCDVIGVNQYSWQSQALVAMAGNDEAGAVAPGQNPPQNNMFFLLMQVGLVAFAVHSFMGRQQQSSQPQQQQPAVTVDEFSAAVPPPAQIKPEQQSWAAMFLMTPSTQVHEALQDFEAHRKSLLSTVRRHEHARTRCSISCLQVPSGQVLPNLWGPDSTFDMFVFLSTSPNPDIATEDRNDALKQGTARFVERNSSHATPSPEFTLADTLSEGWRKGFVGRAWTSLFNSTAKTTAPPENVTAIPPWTGLADIDGLDGRAALLWHASGLRYGQGESSHGSLHVNVSVPESVKHNGTVFAHVLMCRSVPQGGCPSDPERHFRIVYPVVLHRKQRNKRELRSLLDEAQDGENVSIESKAQPVFGIGLTDEPKALTDSDDDTDSSVFPNVFGKKDDRPVLPYWRPTLHIATVLDQGPFTAGRFPPFVAEHLHVPPSRRGYQPLTVVNDWWLLSRKFVEVNETVSFVPLEVSWEGVSLMYWSMMSQWVTQSQMQQSYGLQQEGESEMIKQIILETNPWLLGITFVVSTLHMVFDFLAFRSDISFWRRAKTMEGLSVKSIVINVVVQLIVLLYLFDNDTSWMILISNSVGLAIEVWKLRKAIAVSVLWEGGMPRLQWADKDDGYVRSKTKQYDDEAITHLGAMLYPVVIGYALYSLFYSRHRSWYSWLLSSCVGFVYTFGFILLVPQVYLNYKLKSVAHMPWKAMVYKSLNTVIDDFFAFIISAPTLHRLATFRDDIIFLVYLYQRWVYPVDRKRVNEFGTSGEDELRAHERAMGIKRASARAKTDKHLYVRVADAGTLAPRNRQ